MMKIKLQNKRLKKRYLYLITRISNNKIINHNKKKNKFSKMDIYWIKVKKLYKRRSNIKRLVVCIILEIHVTLIVHYSA